MKTLPIFLTSAAILAAITAVSMHVNVMSWDQVEVRMPQTPPVSSMPLAVTLPAVEDDGQTVLVVAGPQGQRAFTRSELEALGSYRVRTRSFWPSDEGDYEGPLLADVLAMTGLQHAASIRLIGRDDFETVIPRADWLSWRLMLATRRDNAVLDLASKGPVRIIYPRDLDRTLLDPVYRLRWIWMVERIEEGPN